MLIGVVVLVVDVPFIVVPSLIARERYITSEIRGDASKTPVRSLSQCRTRGNK